MNPTVMCEYEGEEYMLGKWKLIKTKYTTIDDEYIQLIEKFSKFEFSEDDVLLVTYPKSGTVWMKRILSLIITDGDIKKAEEDRVDKVIQNVRLHGMPAKEVGQGPRFMSTHLNYRYLPETIRNGKGKVIYVSRNPKDVLVSSYFFYQAFEWARIKLSFDEFFKLFINGWGKNITQSNAPFGHWDEHIKNYWENRNGLNFLHVTYEDLHQSLEHKVGEIAAFIGKELTTDQIKTIAAHSRFDKVKNNPTANYSWAEESGLIDRKISPFMRKGEVGDWKNYLTPQMSKQLENVVETKLLPLGLNFIYELNETL